MSDSVERMKAPVREAMRGTDWPWAELDRVIEIESEWNTRARNPRTNASGLLQFMPFALKRWKLTPNQVRDMSIAEQAPLIRRWFDEREGEGCKYRVRGDTYMAVAAPAHCGAPNNRIVYRRGSKAWRFNPVWRPRDGGHITAGSIRATVLRRLPTRGERIRPLQARKKTRHPTKWFSLVLLAFALAAATKNFRA